jgi:hypothetical protein
MPRRLRKISPATVIALLALFVSLGGTATAITLITGRNVKDGSLTGADVRDRSLTRSDLSIGTLTRGPAGPAGPAGEAGEPGLRGAQGIEGVAGTDPWDTIPSGQLVTGSGHYRLDAGASGEELAVTVQLQARAAVALTTGTVNFSDLDLTADPLDRDASCSGTETAPSAPAGRVCLYVSSSPAPFNVQPGSASGDISPDGRTGFTVHWQAAASGVTELAFTWAYLAP